jgi:hypothetical protein
MNITLKKAEELVSNGVQYKVFPVYSPYKTMEEIGAALRDGFISDLIIDHYDEEGYEDESDNELNSGDWIVTSPEIIEIVVYMRQCETWEERQVRLVG